VIHNEAPPLSLSMRKREDLMSRPLLCYSNDTQKRFNRRPWEASSPPTSPPRRVQALLSSLLLITPAVVTDSAALKPSLPLCSLTVCRRATAIASRLRILLEQWRLAFSTAPPSPPLPCTVLVLHHERTPRQHSYPPYSRIRPRGVFPY
jgi:hypothetical protein